MKTFLLCFLGLAALGGIMSAEAPRPDTNSSNQLAAASAPEPRCGATMAEFEKLTTGMSLTRVSAVIGCKGETLSKSEMAGITTAMYQWRAEDGSFGNMNVMIQNGGLISKAQFGLN